MCSSVLFCILVVLCQPPVENRKEFGLKEVKEAGLFGFTVELLLKAVEAPPKAENSGRIFSCKSPKPKRE